jgi:predicted nucleic acid-binding protein
MDPAGWPRMSDRLAELFGTRTRYDWSAAFGGQDAFGTVFSTRYAGRAGWTRAVREELTRQRSRKPPHPQAGRANNWAVAWLLPSIEIVDSADQMAIATIQEQIALGSQDDSLDHLGEASCIHLLAAAGAGRLISDDHGARAVARGRYWVRASSTVGVLTELLARGAVTPQTVDLHLDILRMNRRMSVSITSQDLFRRALGPWE